MYVILFCCSRNSTRLRRSHESSRPTRRRSRNTSTRLSRTSRLALSSFWSPVVMLEKYLLLYILLYNYLFRGKCSFFVMMSSLPPQSEYQWLNGFTFNTEQKLTFLSLIIIYIQLGKVLIFCHDEAFTAPVWNSMTEWSYFKAEQNF